VTAAEVKAAYDTVVKDTADKMLTSIGDWLKAFVQDPSAVIPLPSCVVGGDDALDRAWQVVGDPFLFLVYFFDRRHLRAKTQVAHALVEKGFQVGDDTGDERVLHVQCPGIVEEEPPYGETEWSTRVGDVAWE
jgi:hypothetical protein